MSLKHKIDIVLPTCNRPQYLGEALRYIQRQTYPYWHVIIVDGGDVLKTQSLATSIIPSEKVRIIQVIPAPHLEGEQRIANARNAGMALGDCEYIAHVDDDNIFLPTHLEKLMAAIQSGDDVEFAYADSLRIDQTGQATSFQAGGPYSLARLLEENFIASDDVLHSRKLYEQVGPIREDIVFYADWEYWVRLALHTHVVHVPEILTVYREHATQASCELNMEKHKKAFLNVHHIVNEMATRLNHTAKELPAVTNLKIGE